MDQPQMDLEKLAKDLSTYLISKHRNEFEIGRLVEQVFLSECWRNWPSSLGGPFLTFDAWCWGVLHCKMNKAFHLRRIYKYFRAMNADDRTISSAMRIGWTKIGPLMRVAHSESALLTWLDKIEQFKLNRAHVVAEVEAVEKGTQTLDKVGEVVVKRGAEDKAPAGYSKKLTLLFKDDESFNTVQKAVEIIQRRHPKVPMSQTQAIALLCTYYMATCPRDDEGGSVLEFDNIIKSLEVTYGFTVGQPVVNNQEPQQPQQEFEIF